MIFVLLLFWILLLVWILVWKVLLQSQGVINDIFVWMGLVVDDNCFELINNMIGIIIVMMYILLLFMILLFYLVMKIISLFYVCVVKFMGVIDWIVFWCVYFLNLVFGIGVGFIFVFILVIGYYIMLELVGGMNGVFILNWIVYYISSLLNWGLVVVFGIIFLVFVFVFYWFYDCMVGIDNVKFGG